MIADVKKAAEQKMQKSVETLKTDLGKVRTGRDQPGRDACRIVVAFDGMKDVEERSGTDDLVDDGQFVRRAGGSRHRAANAERGTGEDD